MTTPTQLADALDERAKNLRQFLGHDFYVLLSYAALELRRLAELEKANNAP